MPKVLLLRPYMTLDPEKLALPHSQSFAIASLHDPRSRETGSTQAQCFAIASLHDPGSRATGSPEAQSFAIVSLHDTGSKQLALSVAKVSLVHLTMLLHHLPLHCALDSIVQEPSMNVSECNFFCMKKFDDTYKIKYYSARLFLSLPHSNQIYLLNFVVISSAITLLLAGPQLLNRSQKKDEINTGPIEEEGPITYFQDVKNYTTQKCIQRK